MLQKPEHGVLKDNGGGGYSYFPNAGYLGKDRATFEVEHAGEKLQIIYFFRTIEGGVDPMMKETLCPRGVGEWKISSSFTTPTLDNLALQSLLNATGITNGVTVNFSDLSGSAVGQTTNSTITLDTNAAGYGWYIDYTPYLNDEYLPTSNPNLWIAKEGTEAAGKMDLLSVLLHEYGHALGLDHSADSSDYMAATLQPGVRRLPSSDELALMARLEINGDRPRFPI